MLFGQILIVWYKYISNVSSLHQKFHFPVEVVLNFLQTEKGLELVFRSQFCGGGGGGGGVEPPIKFSKRGGLTGPFIFRGGFVEKRG